MYTYPEALTAMERIARDMFKRAGWTMSLVVVIPDMVTGTASVDWNGMVPGNKAGAGHSGNSAIIRMPVRPATYRMSATEFDHWAAYVLHEVGHPLWTSKQVWETAVRTNRHKLLNSVEDVREENETIKLGIAFNAKAAFSALVESLNVKALADGYNPNHVRSFGWTISLFGREANGYDLPSMKDVRRKLKPNGPIAKVLEWALPALAKCKSTADCLKLVDKLSKALANLPKDVAPTPPPLKGNSGEGKSGEQGKGEQYPDGDASRGEGEQYPDGDASRGEGEGEQGKGEGKPGEGEAGEGKPGEGEAGEPYPDGDASRGEGEAGAGAGKGTGEPQGDRPPLDDGDFDAVDLKPNHKEDMKPKGNQDFAFDAAKKIIQALRNGEKQARSFDIGSRGKGASSEFIVKRAATMGKQRALLARCLKKNEIETYEGNRINGRFNRHAVAKMLNGNPAIFGKRHVSEGYDTDVEILVDGSSSMMGFPIEAAATLALVVAQAAGQVGVDCTAHLFTYQGLAEITKGKRKPKPQNFGYMVRAVCGGTPLTESLISAAMLQAKRASGKRRVLFVITDGGCNSGPNVVREAGKYIEKAMGTEIANLHIGPSVMGIFSNEVAVDIGNVAATGLRQLVSVLERNA